MKAKANPWDVVDMRHLPGCTILELQTMAKEGLLTIDEPTNDIKNISDVLGHINEAELEALKECFLYFDRNEQGYIKKEEFGMALRSAGLVITNKEAQVISDKYDLEGTGNIDLKSYLCAVAEHSAIRSAGEEDIRRAFSVFDKNGDGLINVKEMSHVLSRIGDFLNEEEVNALMEALDKHNDGFIRMDELVKILAMTNTEFIYDN